MNWESNDDFCFGKSFAESIGYIKELLDDKKPAIRKNVTKYDPRSREDSNLTFHFYQGHQKDTRCSSQYAFAASSALSGDRFRDG
jgi:hypothetical protein